MHISPRRSVFVSYSHRDRIWLEKLRPHLGSLARERGLDIDFWDDTRITPGDLWESELLNALTAARVAILLVSSHFLDSNYIGTKELPHILEAARDARTQVLPIIVSSCRYVHHAMLGKLQSVNPPNQPLEGMTTARRNELFLRITELVDAALDNAAQLPASATTTPGDSSTDLHANIDEPIESPAAKIHEYMSPKLGACTSLQASEIPLQSKKKKVPHTLQAPEVDEDWQRIVIQRLADGSLLYQSIRAEEFLEGRVSSPQTKLIDRLLKECITFFSHRDVTALLYELLVPANLKNRLFVGPGALLTLDSYTSCIPWELLFDGNEPEIGLRCSILRKMVAINFTPRHECMVNQATVIGSPLIKFSDENISDLPGAEAEARQVAEQLSHAGFEVDCLIGKGSVENFSALLSKPCRVLHLTGHGAYEAVNLGEDRAISGFLIGDDIILSSTEILQFRTAPELVFLNASYLGRPPSFKGNTSTTKEAEKFNQPNSTASIPDQFLAIGTHAVIAPIGVVDDQSAAVFAEAFYHALFAGRRLGEAVFEARLAAHS